MNDNELDVATATWLVSSDGLAAVTTATSQLDAGSEPLAVGTQLRASGISNEHAAATLAVASARRRARDEWSDADDLLFTRSALEQASHPEVASWRARRFAGQHVWDLCAGIGGDAMALTRRASSLTAVERDPALAILLEHNLRTCRVAAQVLVEDALAATVAPGAAVHADPARRDAGQRRHALRDHRPPIGELVRRHNREAGLGIVLSPAVDLADPDLPDAELEFLQVGERLVEAIAWTGALRRADTAATATLLPAGETWHRSGDPSSRPRRPVGEVCDHLVEIAPAAIRARLHDEIGASIGAHRLASTRALLTVGDQPPPSPWYRTRPVRAVLSARPRAVRSWLRTNDAGPVEVVLHGVRDDVGRWWRELGRPPRGPEGSRIEVVRLDHGAIVVITDARSSRDRRGGQRA